MKALRSIIITSICASVIYSLSFPGCKSHTDEGKVNKNSHPESKEIGSSDVGVKKEKDVKDIDGNIYTTVQIGAQVWMVQNLNVGTYRDGSSIKEARSEEEWIEAGARNIPAWCFYQNDPSNGKKYGKLYNWFAVNDPRGLAPKGWHIPTDAEWIILTDYLLGEDSAGLKLKSSNGWAKGGDGINSVGFCALPSGLRYFNGSFDDIGYYGHWWSNAEHTIFNATSRKLSFCYKNAYPDVKGKKNGLSVRCIKDKQEFR